MTIRTKRILTAAAIILILAVAGGAWWLYHSLDSLVASAIRRFGPEITGVSIGLDRVTIDARDGRATVYGLVVGNPEGFSSNPALSLGEISMTLDLESLTKNVIVIKRIAIVKPEVGYELGPGGSNLQAIQRNVDRYVAQHRGKSAQPTDPTSGTKLVIDDLSIQQATAHLSATVIDTTRRSVPIPDVRLRHIGKQSGGATAGEAVKQVLGALTQSVTRTIAERGLGGTIDRLKDNPGSALDSIRGLVR